LGANLSSLAELLKLIVTYVAGDFSKSLVEVTAIALLATVKTRHINNVKTTKLRRIKIIPV
jgi:hypothetical protein